VALVFSKRSLKPLKRDATWVEPRFDAEITYAEIGPSARISPGRSLIEKPDHRHRRLLCARRERPCHRCAAQTADEISTSEWTVQHVFSTLPVGIIVTVSPRPVPVLG
jgi:hypothetical protein